MTGLCPGACAPNLNFVCLAILELLAFNFSGIMSGLFLGACVPNVKFVFSAILELLPFKELNIRLFLDYYTIAYAYVITEPSDFCFDETIRVSVKVCVLFPCRNLFTSCLIL